MHRQRPGSSTVLRRQQTIEPIDRVPGAEHEGHRLLGSLLEPGTGLGKGGRIGLDRLGAQHGGHLDPRTALALWGSKDFQVVPEPNKANLDALVAEHALPVESSVYDGLNHLFQPAGTGLIDEYGAIDTTIDPKVLADVVAWIAEAVGKPGPVQRPLGDSDALPRRVWTLPAAGAAK